MNKTKEELEAETQRIIAEAEELEKQPIVEEEDEQETEPEKQEEEIKEAEPSAEVKEQLRKEVEEKNKKLSASAREAQKLYAKNRVINQALAEADDIPEPTEEELTKEYTDYELMSDFEKKVARETLINKKWRQTVSQAKEQAQKIEKWNDSVIEFVDDPKTFIEFPELEGNSDEFKEFASKQENNSVPFKVLVSSFLYEQSKNKKSNKGSMFLDPSGGPNEKLAPKSDKVSLKEAEIIKKSDYARYKELLKNKKIDYDL